MHGLSQTTPVMLCFSDHDPTGSAGIQADIETAASLGCHCASAITALSVRNKQSHKSLAANHTLLTEQARSVLETLPVAAIKIGFAGGLANIKAIHSILIDYPEIPVVLDIVAQISTGSQAHSRELYAAVTTLLLPLATLATPSFFEAHEMAHQADTTDACAHAMLDCGCQFVLISDTLTDTNTFSNTLYGDQRLLKRYDWPRIGTACNGSSASLAASITAYLARGFGLLDAVEQGQKFTWQSLKQAHCVGGGHYIPNRLYGVNNTTTLRQPLNTTH